MGTVQSSSSEDYDTAQSSSSSDDGEDMNEFVTDMASSVRAVEKLLHYKFKNEKLLEEALTHSSCPDSASYQRLEFFGDAVIGLAVSNHIFVTYPTLDEGSLTLLRTANVSNEKLARAAVKHDLYRYVVRHNVSVLDENVRDFAIAVKQEDEIELDGGAIKAPKILADIVESVAAAVYVDCGFNLQASWPIFEHLLDPIVTLDLLQKQPHPVTKGKQLEITPSKEGGNNIANVFVDGQRVASASSKQQEIAKLLAAKDALPKLSFNTGDKMSMNSVTDPKGSSEFEGAKQKLHNLCGKKKWPKPSYRIEKKIGPAHDRKFICSVRIEIARTVLFAVGDGKVRKKDAENSAASMMLLDLQE